MVGSPAYYLHPLLAGPIAGWTSHFARIRRLGFGSVVVAPPFAPGPDGNIFVVEDHARLHPALGGGSAADGLARAAELADKHGLRLMLDLVAGRLSPDAAVVRRLGYVSDAARRDDPPDPRRLRQRTGAAILSEDAPSGPWVGWWGEQIAIWTRAGIAGFRCEAAQEVPASFWRALISQADTVFIASTPGATRPQLRALQNTGFDYATSSSPAWDYAGDWLEQDTRLISAVGRVLAAPEAPFGERAAMGDDGAEAAARAVRFAAGFGQALMIPMGFEYGARAPLDRVHAKPEDFADLAAHPHADLQPAIAEAIALQERFAGAGPARLVSPPHAPTATFERIAGDRRFLLHAEKRGRVWLEETVLLVPIASVQPDISIATDAARIAIEAVAPSADDGRFAVKRVAGSTVQVSADIFADGHEMLAACVLWRADDEAEWHEQRMALLVNDRWTAHFPVERVGTYRFTILAWIDVFGAWRDEVTKKHAAGVPIPLELREGVALVAAHVHAPALAELAARLADAGDGQRLAELLSPQTEAAMRAADKRPFSVRLEPGYTVWSERKQAAFAAWYELFPRSETSHVAHHGTFTDVIARLPAIRDMGFDVLYFPPIHPIGKSNRKGPNNTLVTGPDDVGSPYAIGSAEGGHDAIHPELGSFAEFRALIEAAASHGLEIALDFAIQCAPDHPWLREHPGWFAWRADGSLRYAENPPKKYQDIVNVAFYAPGAVPSLWLALRDIVLFWIEQGVSIFRVDNPHTKPLPFWEWMIADVRARHPAAMFLAEAFTRPKPMYRLAKCGFSQSYTYFTWRDTAAGLAEYMTELTTEAPREFFRPHFFVNTPDINPIFLQGSGRPGFLIRAALAATLSGLWGMYSGFEICEAAALPGREEYLDSEKYQIRVRDWDAPGNIVAEISHLNAIRRTNPALHSHLGVAFLPCANPSLLCYIKTAETNRILVMVSTDPHRAQDGDFDLYAAALGMAADGRVRAEDLIAERQETWNTGWRHVRLDPSFPYSIWRLSPAPAAGIS